MIDNNDKNLIRETTKNEQKFKRLNINNKKEIKKVDNKDKNAIKEIIKDGAEIKRLNKLNLG